MTKKELNLEKRMEEHIFRCLAGIAIRGINYGKFAYKPRFEHQYRCLSYDYCPVKEKEDNINYCRAEKYFKKEYGSDDY